MLKLTNILSYFPTNKKEMTIFINHFPVVSFICVRNPRESHSFDGLFPR